MRELLRSSVATDAYSLKLALEAAGIPAVVRGEALSGIHGNPFSVWVVAEEDYGRARDVLEEVRRGSV